MDAAQSGLSFWRLARDLTASAAAGSPAGDALDLVYSAFRCQDPGDGGVVRIETTVEAGSPRMCVNGSPAFHAWSERHLPPALEINLTRLAVARSPDFAVFHASAVRIGESAVMILGEKGGGKSTLSLWLARRGALYGGDELVFFRLADGQPQAFPKAAAIKGKAFPHFEETATWHDPIRGAVRYFLPGNALAPFAPLGPVHLVCVARFDPRAAAAAAIKLPAREAAMALIQQSFGGLRRHPGVLDLVGELSQRPVCAIEFSDLEEAGKLIEKICGVGGGR